MSMPMLSLRVMFSCVALNRMVCGHGCLFCECRAGAQALQVFESHAGELDESTFLEYCVPMLKDIASGVRRECSAAGIECPPLIVFARNAHTNTSMEQIALCGYDAISVDWAASGAQVRTCVDAACAAAGVRPPTLQGNFDPIKLFGSPEFIRAEVKRMMESFGVDRYVANLGHGMMPSHDPEHLRVFVDAVHEHSALTCQQKIG